MINNKTLVNIAVQVVVCLLVCFSTTVFAAAKGCPAQYWSGIAPSIGEQMAVKSHEICYSSFAVMHSGITRSPLWSAEHLTRKNLVRAKGLMRVNNFHADDHLSHSERAELIDYARSGYDRGHMAPSGDMPNSISQEECFTLANMIPQNHDNNTVLWEGIEAAVRTFAKREGELYVITGPLYLGDSVNVIHGRVMVPSHIYKVIYDTSQSKGAAYYVENKPGMGWQALSIAELEKISHINFFPSMSLMAKQVKLDIPAPTPYERKQNRSYK